jgi:uncharacterized protein YkwD
MMKKLFLVLAVIAAGTSLAVLPGCKSKENKVTTNAAFSVEACVSETNQNRAHHGLPPLEIDPRLMEAAGIQSFNMARLSKLSHELNVPGERTVTERVNKTGFPWSGIAENIAWNYPPSAVVEGWMNSSGHRRNILGNYTHIGVACSLNEEGEPYYTQVFGKIAGR